MEEYRFLVTKSAARSGPASQSVEGSGAAVALIVTANAPVRVFPFESANVVPDPKFAVKPSESFVAVRD